MPACLLRLAIKGLNIIKGMVEKTECVVGVRSHVLKTLSFPLFGISPINIS